MSENMCSVHPAPYPAHTHNDVRNHPFSAHNESFMKDNFESVSTETIFSLK